MAVSQETSKPSGAIARRLAKLFTREAPEDQAAAEALEHINDLQLRIERIREDVQRGVRNSEKRFRL